MADEVAGKGPWPHNAVEVGFAFNGCTDVEAQRDALQKLIDDCGDDKRDWFVLPEIREYHNHEARAGVADFGRRVVVDRSVCSWAAYGVRLVHPQMPPHYVAEGVRLPVLNETPQGAQCD